MIILSKGVYLSFLKRKKIKLIYKGNNLCDLYINDQYKGIAPFDYVKQRLFRLEKKQGKVNDSAIVEKYKFQEIKS